MNASPEFIAELRRGMELSGVLKPKGDRHYAEDVVWHKFCQNCGKENPAGMARVCSGECYVKSKRVAEV